MQLQTLGTEDLNLYCTFLLIICLIVFTKVLSFRLFFLFYTCEGSRYLQVLDFFGRTILLFFYEYYCDELMKNNEKDGKMTRMAEIRNGTKSLV